MPGGGVHLPLVVAQPLPLIKALSASPASLIDWAVFLRDSLELESKARFLGTISAKILGGSSIYLFIFKRFLSIIDSQ